ncbi:MAG: hypothetical protein U9O98_10290 [Asgard group archaeon]|nr:hypothetical protein [Asgard group archaeon]
MVTRGIVAEIPPETQAAMLKVALQELTAKKTWVVFSSETTKKYVEDQERTVVYPLSALDGDCSTEVYTILDDYGTKEALQKSAGNPFLETQFVLTMLLPEEY